MKRALFWLMLALLLPVAIRAQENFTERLSPEERQSAGLDRLTPEQLVALNALVKRDRESGEKSLRATVRAELREEVKQEARTEAKVEARKESEERRLAETRVLSRIVGKFSGWDGKTVFKLENGQIWRQADPDVHYVKPVDSPAVLIEKVFGGWRLYDQEGGWVRVIRIK
jgi:hypothetical protein